MVFPEVIEVRNARIAAGAATLALAAATLSIATPATAASVPTDLVVGLRTDAAAATTVGDLTADPDVDVLGSKVTTQLDAVTVTVPAADRADAIAALRADPNVTYVEPNHTVSITDVTADDPYYAQQWGLTRTAVPTAWNTTTGSSSVVVAVVDTGVTAVSELAGRILPGYDVVNKDDDPTDDNGHGTMAATVIAGAGNNAGGMAGVCWTCKILPVKVMGASGSGNDQMTAAGIVWAADHGADVINLSLGGPADSQLLRSAVQYAWDRNVVVVASAGNDGVTTRFYPAAIDQAIAVAGSTDGDARYGWSNYNAPADAWVDLAAPGSNIAQTRAGSYGWFTGTSSAGPVVSGVAALALAARPDATAAQVRAALEGGADNVGTWVAKGRVNAAATFAKITGGTFTPAPATPGKDVTAPVISGIKLSGVRGPITITPVVTDDVAVTTVKATITANGRTASVVPVSSPWAVTWNSSGFTGTATIVITASDAAGNAAAVTKTFAVDNTAPSSAITLPGFVNGRTDVTLAAPADDLARMDLYIKDKLVGSATAAPWTVSWNTEGLSGALTLRVVATDVAGNTSTTSKAATVDNVAPKVTWSAPAATTGIGALRGTINVTGSGTDMSGITKMEVLDADGNVLGTDTTAPFAIPVDTTRFTGATTLTLRATDRLGQTGAATRTYVFDNTAPVFGDIAINPSRTVVIAPTVSDNVAVKSMKTVLTLPTGRTVSLSSSAAPWKVAWAAGAMTGTVTAVITATDTAGNTMTSATQFTLGTGTTSKSGN